MKFVLGHPVCYEQNTSDLGFLIGVKVLTNIGVKTFWLKQVSKIRNIRCKRPKGQKCKRSKRCKRSDVKDQKDVKRSIQFDHKGKSCKNRLYRKNSNAKRQDILHTEAFLTCVFIRV